jgi:serine/threonine protein kinase
MLIDFGSGVYPDAAVLTAPDMYPGTPAYRSPESGLFELQSLRQRSARYRAGPADDLFALGVTACRLLTGEYPSFCEPEQDEQGRWRLEAVHTPVALQRVEPVLRERVLRLLSVRPEERGTAAQLAEALEQASQPAPRRRPAAASPEVENSGAERGAGGTISAENGRAQVEARRWLWLAVGSGLTLATWMAWTVATKLVEKLASAHVMEAPNSQADGGTAGLGEAAASTASVDFSAPSSQGLLAEESPPKPVPGQIRPDVNGRCPRKQQMALNGGCWVQVPLEREECEAARGTLFKSECYLPLLPTHPLPTSTPPPK